MSERRYIVIEGPIGVGKTSLARRLAENLDGELLLEEAEANPFLERFYRDPRGAALPAQLFFLFQRVRQIEQLRQPDIFNATRIADFMIEKDRLSAGINLDRHELALYEKVSESLAVEPPVPDLVVYLQAPVDTLLFRIARRGLAYEQRVSRRYLERLAEAYARFFHDYDAAPLLIVNAATIDPVHNDEHSRGFDLLPEGLPTSREFLIQSPSPDWIKRKPLSATSLPAGRQVRLCGEPDFERRKCQSQSSMKSTEVAINSGFLGQR